MIHLELLQLCLIIVCIIDLSGVVWSIKCGLGKLFQAEPEHIRLAPLDCSKCMTFWVGTIYALAVGQLTLGLILYILVLALLTTAFASLGGIIITKIERMLQKWID